MTDNSNLFATLSEYFIQLMIGFLLGHFCRAPDGASRTWIDSTPPGIVSAPIWLVMYLVVGSCKPESRLESVGYQMLRQRRQRICFWQNYIKHQRWVGYLQVYRLYAVGYALALVTLNLIPRFVHKLINGKGQSCVATNIFFRLATLIVASLAGVGLVYVLVQIDTFRAANVRYHFSPWIISRFFQQPPSFWIWRHQPRTQVPTVIH